MEQKQKALKKLVLASAVAGIFALSGCGGGGGGGGGSGAATGSSRGILTDAPVAGVAYTTSSGVAGTTDANGGYDFNIGDTVVFKIGNLILGNVTATGIVSPLELANGDANKLQNLLVMLQSLDANADPEKISIPANAAAAVTTAIDLTVAPASFNTSALQTAMTAGGIATPIVSTTNANAHFLAQGMTLLSSNIWAFHIGSGTTDTGFIRFNPNGEYLHGQAETANGSGMPGVEYGTASLPSFDVNGYKLVATTSVDTNGEWGASHPLNCDRFRSVGEQLFFTEDRTTPTTCANSTNLDPASKAENDPTGIVGVWAMGSATTIKTQHFVFFSNGKFLMVDPLGDTQGNQCGGPGVEAGSYTYNSATKVLKVSSFTFDTNGCAGLSESGAVTANGVTFTISSDGNTISLVDGADSDTLYRVSK